MLLAVCLLLLSKLVIILVQTEPKPVLFRTQLSCIKPQTIQLTMIFSPGILQAARRDTRTVASIPPVPQEPVPREGVDLAQDADR